jgi:hypothetical protein
MAMHRHLAQVAIIRVTNKGDSFAPDVIGKIFLDVLKQKNRHPGEGTAAFLMSI